MDWPHKLAFSAFLIVAAYIHGVHGYVMVTGTVFCDQCKDGQVTLFDYPMRGITVTMACPGEDGQLRTWGNLTTNWMGNYAMRFDGTPDLTNCFAQVSGYTQGPNNCAVAAGPAKYLRLMFRVFDMEMYSVDPLLSQPAEPMSFCSRSSVPAPVPLAPARSPPAPHLPPLPPYPRLPPLPRLPPMPFLEASACPSNMWMSPEYRCHWRVLRPDTKVSLVFGLLAARRYGTDMTLWQGMKGRGDPYRTLLREATTALLNSYNSVQFLYHPFGVVQHMNWALMGSSRQVLHTALAFMRANSGKGNGSCKFKPCK